MNKTLLAAGGALLMVAACGGLRPVAPSAGSVAAAAASSASASASADDPLTLLERACLDDPMNAAHWARLAAALDGAGQRARAARLYQQAASLSAHDARRDYALLRSSAPAVMPSADVRSGVEPYATMPRTQVQPLGAALVQLVRLPAPAAAAPIPASSPDPAPSISGPARLEISNGNGVTGAAARLARTLDSDQLQAVRLTNVKDFNEPLSRIEYVPAQQAAAHALSQRLAVPLAPGRTPSARADLRIVIGHDARQRQFR
ncbi:MAG: LytR C-terminal domain-containing protein [Duganella sp.]